MVESPWLGDELGIKGEGGIDKIKLLIKMGELESIRLNLLLYFIFYEHCKAVYMLMVVHFLTILLTFSKLFNCKLFRIEDLYLYLVCLQSFREKILDIFLVVGGEWLRKSFLEGRDTKCKYNLPLSCYFVQIWENTKFNQWAWLDIYIVPWLYAIETFQK